MADYAKPKGVGLGLRRELLDAVLAEPDGIDFLEVAPENWMAHGGRIGKRLREFTERFAFTTHGLSLSLGSPAPLDEDFVRAVGQFLDRHEIAWYSEHLSYCGDEGHLYDLLPIPFSEGAVDYVAERIQRVQQITQRRMIIENVSYYAAPGAEMSELEFVNAVLEKADCRLLLDINNIYVNSVNHGYDAREFLAGLPSDRIAYAHIAGHDQRDVDLIVDTHGADVVDPVWALLDEAYRIHGVFPTLLERDFNIPPLPDLKREMARIRQSQGRASSEVSRAAV